MMNEGNDMKTELTAAEIIALINERQVECLDLVKIFESLGNRRMTDMYNGEVTACSMLLHRIQEASK